MTKYKEIGGIKYAEGVEPAKEGPMSQDLIDSLKEPAKIRITTMIDVDVYNELKRVAEQSGSKYQTIMNGLLRELVLPDEGKPSIGQLVDLSKEIKQMLTDTKASIVKTETKIENLRKKTDDENVALRQQVDKMWKMLATMERPTKPKPQPKRNRA